MYNSVASFDTLMSNLYKVTLDKNEKIQIFVIKLEEALNQTRSRFPAKLKVEGHLRNHLFYGINNTLRDSLYYKYTDPNLSYRDLLLTAQKTVFEACGSRVTNSTYAVKVKAAQINQRVALI